MRPTNRIASLIYLSIGMLTFVYANPVRSQKKNDTAFLEDYVNRSSLSIRFSNLNPDTINTLAYLVLYNEKSELDTILFSHILPDSMDINKKELAELREDYSKLHSINSSLDLKNASIFVPILLLPGFAYYKVLLNEEQRRKAYESWLSMFSIINSETLDNSRVRYAVPVVITISRHR
ncbi:hypothetical protein EDD80_1052 [Anseongella ginsenosidimutans]|uniref:Uncharacterized protein n=1 Tax=Anseongella ginsenosidimutans TaxID=496056 RepID=A0A4R3KR33_9SPHI|nr:hypothetical protein EDD80_1052 [Anseongella ginsenosidimutans]